MKDPIQTPRWIDAVIDDLAPDDLAEEIRGDLFELFVKDIEHKGMAYARTKYIFNGLGFLAKRFFWKRSRNTISNSSLMVSSYFKMARRSLMANKATTTINILGLVTGIASALVILAVVRFETSFDRFHTKYDRIYRVIRVSGKDMNEFRSGISHPVPAALDEEIPILEDVVPMEYFGGANVDVLDRAGNAIHKFREESGFVLVDEKFFNVFDFKGTGFKWLSGNAKNALSDPYMAVLTRTMAKKYFGDKDPVGQSIRIQRQTELRITGVVEDLPYNTDFPFTVFISYPTVRKLAGEARMSNWFSVNDSHQAFVVIPEGVTQSEIEERIAKVHAAHTPKDLHESRHYLLQPLSDLHHDARFRNYNGRSISRETLIGLSVIAVFLLLTGSINYINLATAQSVLRAKEIGLRKVMGGNKTNLLGQFMVETFVIVGAAGIIALGLSEVLLSNLQPLLNMRLDGYNFTDPFTIVCFAAVIAVVTLLAGFYPAIVISRFNPVTTLKNKFNTGSYAGISMRKVLVVVQFTITQILVVGTFIVISQMNHFRNRDMGFISDAVVTARLPVRNLSTLMTMKEQLRSQAFASGVSLSFTLPSGVNRNRSFADIGKPEAEAMGDYLVFEYISVDPSYLDLYEIDLLAGRNLTFQDSLTGIMINETLVKALDLGTPKQAVGKELEMGDGRTRFTVVGVVEDYHSNSFKEAVGNMVFFIEPENYAAVSIKLDVQRGKGSMHEAITQIGKVWSATFPDYIFNYQFLDENIAAFYAQEEKYEQLFELFSIVFLVIGCLGLYGLVTFVVNRKGKEVAIRKVLGASLTNIIAMFSREYVQLILLSFVLAVPIAYYFVNDWLSNFASHISLDWWLFAAPGLIVLLIAILVVSTKSFKAANTNPIEKLKYE